MHITKFWDTNRDARISNPTIHNTLTLELALQAFVTIVKSLIGTLPVISRDPPCWSVYCKSSPSVGSQ
jgi:hypothetical protein